jgi:hypothetical protein
VRCEYILTVVNTDPAFAETVAALQAFRKRHGDAQRVANTLQNQPTTVDISHYRSLLKNQAIVDEAEKTMRDFKPVTYDVSSHVKAIEAFEAKAVRVSLHPGRSFGLRCCWRD